MLVLRVRARVKKLYYFSDLTSFQRGFSFWVLGLSFQYYLYIDSENNQAHADKSLSI